MISNHHVRPVIVGQASQHLFHRLKDLERCLYLQLYYWGRDVLHPHGNQLVAHGFRRIAKTTQEGTSRYRLSLGGGTLELHGWCISWYRPEGVGFVYVRRRRRLFLWDSPEPANPHRLIDGRYRIPQNTGDWLDLGRIMQTFVHWWLEYENWIAQQQGATYREGIFREYQRLPRSSRWLSPAVQLSWLGQFRSDPLMTPSVRALLVMPHGGGHRG